MLPFIISIISIMLAVMNVSLAFRYLLNGENMLIGLVKSAML
jgi:hypothetical protein